MSAEVSLLFPATGVSKVRPGVAAMANKALRASARFWFVVTMSGQLFMAFAVAAFYGMTAARGDVFAWNRHMTHGYAAGKPMGNFAVAMHLLSAFVILAAGATQFIPAIRTRFPRVHRWTGRFYMLAAVGLSAAGLYMHFVSGAVGDASVRWASVVNVVLIVACGAQALRYAIARDFATHRRWSLRFFLVVSASWFFRAGFFATILIAGGPIGFDPVTFTGPLLTGMSYAQFGVPLLVAELYFLAQRSPRAWPRFAMSATLVLLTLFTMAGAAGVAMLNWVPAIREAFDFRKPLVPALFATIDAKGIDAAVRQYHELKATQPQVWNFDEKPLNTLGHQFLRANKYAEAIAVFRLNVEAYPRSSNARDNLGDGYARAGDRAHAIEAYRQALQLNPKNLASAAALRKLEH